MIRHDVTQRGHPIQNCGSSRRNGVIRRDVRCLPHELLLKQSNVNEEGQTYFDNSSVHCKKKAEFYVLIGSCVYNIFWQVLPPEPLTTLTPPPPSRASSCGGSAEDQRM